MTFFVMTERTTSDLYSPIFTDGENGRDESAAIFTTKTAAEEYIREAGWDEKYVAAKLDSLATLHWLVQLYADGVALVAIDPVRASQDANLRLPSINVEHVLGELAAPLGEKLRPQRSAAADELVAFEIYSCQNCSRILRQRRGEPAPHCHGQEMALAAQDSVRRSELRPQQPSGIESREWAETSRVN